MLLYVSKYYSQLSIILYYDDIIIFTFWFFKANSCPIFWSALVPFLHLPMASQYKFPQGQSYLGISGFHSFSESPKVTVCLAD